MLKWIDIPDDYLDYLREKGDSRIPYKDYGTNKCKPFFGALFAIGNLVYATQISHPQPRHYTLPDAQDFIKIYKDDKLLCVINLNYMFPVPINLIEEIRYSKIENYRTFKSDEDKSKYIYLLRQELRIINSKNIETKALKVYNNKYLYPNNVLAKRCIDFRKLEQLSEHFLNNQIS